MIANEPGLTQLEIQYKNMFLQEEEYKSIKIGTKLFS